MYKRRKISLVFPAYNEEANIKNALTEFKRIKSIDEIIVVNNNSKDNTAAIAKKNGAKVILEKQKGYGYALRKGLQVATGDYIFLCEPDGTFQARDIPRFLQKLTAYDVIVGTRTDKVYIAKKANMHGLLRMANISLAKCMQILYRPTCPLSDCGCTYRVMKREVVKKILPSLTVGGSHFLSELMVHILQTKYRVIEIPVHYQGRIGESKITGSLKKAIYVGLQMTKVIIGNKFT